MEFKEKLEKLLKTYNVKIWDCSDIGLGVTVELGEKVIGKAGYNPCVPTNKGKAIYTGRISFRSGESLEEVIDIIMSSFVERKKKVK